MAYMRSLITRSSLVRRKCNPSVGYILHNDDRKENVVEEGPSERGLSNVFHQRSFSNSFNSSSVFGSLATFHLCGNRRYTEFYPASSGGVTFLRHMSTRVGGGTENVEMISDVAEVLSDTTVVQVVATQAPMVNEVAIAAADSFFPIACLQHFIGVVHSYTGLEWWSAIMLTTLIIRGAMLPFAIDQLITTSKLTLIRPRLEEIRAEMEVQGMNPTAVMEGQAKMKKVMKENGLTTFSAMKGMFIQGPIFVCFFLALSNMVEKVPSFKNGGAFWFVDLTTQDSTYALPILTALTFWITVECNMQQGLEGNPMGHTMRNVFRALAVVTVPLTLTFPKAIFFYWITSNVFSLAYGLTLKIPGLKKALGIPDIPVPPPGTAGKQFDLFSALKGAVAAGKKMSSQESTSSSLDQASSSSSVLSQRIKSLERQVKGKKRNKRR